MRRDRRLIQAIAGFRHRTQCGYHDGKGLRRTRRHRRIRSCIAEAKHPSGSQRRAEDDAVGVARDVREQRFDGATRRRHERKAITQTFARSAQS